MTAPGGEEPIANCFLYNTGRPADTDEPPPLDDADAASYNVRLPVTDDDVQIVWSPKGDAVAVRIHGEFVAFIGPDDLLGYSRSVARECEWAHPFDAALFIKLFDMDS